jgi:hypothetical protein
MFVTNASNQPTGAGNLKSRWRVWNLAQVTQRNGLVGGAAGAKRVQWQIEELSEAGKINGVGSAIGCEVLRQRSVPQDIY